jgi:predicted nucleic acid-binding Zn ribbon protein
LPADRPGQTLAEYQARYQAILAAIKDLMFDYEMGKVSAEDYEKLLHKTKLEAAGIRQQMDQLSDGIQPDIDTTLAAEIETLVSQLRQSRFNGSEALLAEVDAEIELLKQIELGPQTLACPNCGQAFRAGDVFCAGCGQSLEAVTPEIKAAEERSCPGCGYAFQADDLFCAHCGTALREEAQSRPYANVKL